MMQWTDTALESLAEIIVYYEAEAGAKLASEARESITTQVAHFDAFPLSAEPSTIYPNARRIVMSRFPYVAFIREINGNWYVLDVVHTSRKLPKTSWE